MTFAAADGGSDDSEFSEEIGRHEASLECFQAPGAEVIDGISERVESGADVMAKLERVAVLPIVPEQNVTKLHWRRRCTYRSGELTSNDKVAIDLD